MSDAFQQDFAYRFLGLMLEGLPLIFLGTIISGFIDVYMPAGFLDKFLPKKRIPSLLVCGLMGLIVPVCECAVVPVIRRLVAKGLPVGSAFAYMLAAPVVNPVTIYSTWLAYSQTEPVLMTFSRLGMAYLVAVTVGIIVVFLPLERIFKKAMISRLAKASDFTGNACGHEHSPKEEGGCCDHGHVSMAKSSCCDHDHSPKEESSCCDHDHSHDHSHAPADRLATSFRVGMRDFLDVAVYFSVGCILAVLFKTSIESNYAWIDSIYANRFAETGFMMLLAFVMSLCSTSDAFIAFSFSDKMSRAGQMAFMVLGPMMDVKLVFLYQTMLRIKFLLLMVVFLVIVIGAMTVSWSYWVEKVKAKSFSQTQLELRDRVDVYSKGGSHA